MVTAEGRVVVLDFGLALEFDVGQASADTGGEWFGTVEYMAPEQARARSRRPRTGTPWGRCCTRRSRAGCRSAARCSTCWRPSGAPRPSRRARSIRRCRPTSSSSACSCWPRSRPTGPDRRRRAPDAGRRHGGARHRARAGRGGARRPRASSRNTAACVSRVGGRAAHLAVRARAVRHGQERRGRSLHRRAAVALAGAGAGGTLLRAGVGALQGARQPGRRAQPPPGAAAARHGARAAAGGHRAAGADVPDARAGGRDPRARDPAPGDCQRAGTPQPRVGRVCRAAGRAGCTAAPGAGHRRPAVGRLGQRGPAGGHVQRAARPGRAAGRIASRGARRRQRVSVGAAAAGRAAGVRAARAGHRRARAFRRRAPGARPARPGLPDGRPSWRRASRRRPAAAPSSSARSWITCRPSRSWPGPACWPKAPRSTRCCAAASAASAAGPGGCWT